MRTTRRIATLVVMLLGAQVVVFGVEALAVLHRIGLLHEAQAGGPVTRAQVDAAWNAVHTAVTIGRLLFFATAAVWCVWQYRAQRRAIELAGGGLEFTPGWAVGWWFVPFANLVKPFQAVRELWRASHGRDAWRHLTTWSVLPWWWGLFVGGGVLGLNGFGRDLHGTPTISDIVSIDRWQVASLVVRASAAVLAIVIVWSVARLQEAATAVTTPPMAGDVTTMPAEASAGIALPPPPPPG